MKFVNRIRKMLAKKPVAPVDDKSRIAEFEREWNSYLRNHNYGRRY